MKVYLDFREGAITPHKYNPIGSNTHTIDAWSMKYTTDKSGEPVIKISLTPESLLTKETQLVTANREIRNYADHRCKYIEIPISELYSAETWD